jgi:N6-L-threonylcarbamoyladenine synthase
MIILGIETSCDETAAAIIEEKDGKIKVLSNIVSSQIELHAKWGGVVPNLAAREHLKNIIPVINESLTVAKIQPKKIDLISVTNGPGLIPALLIGVNVAKTLSYAWKKPLLGIHHIEGHIYANLLNAENETIKFPVLCLIVSGGHTQLILMQDHLNYKIVGQTLDDAVGEAFDKVARILDLGYPGGPIISQLAENYIPENDSALPEIKFPRPMLKAKNLNFSFSGLKTAVLYATKKHPELLGNIHFKTKVAYEFQQATIDVLIHKTFSAAEKYQPKTIMLAGGVSANKELRKQFGEAILALDTGCPTLKEGERHPVSTQTQLRKINYVIPDITYAGDNAAMIAIAGYYRYQKMTASEKKQTIENWKNLKTDANLILK